MQIVKNPKTAPEPYAVGQALESTSTYRRVVITAILPGGIFELTSAEPHIKSGKITVTKAKESTLRNSWRRIRI